MKLIFLYNQYMPMKIEKEEQSPVLNRSYSVKLAQTMVMAPRQWLYYKDFKN